MNQKPMHLILRKIKARRRDWKQSQLCVIIAVKYSFNKIGKGNIAINSNLSPEKNYCHITIADNGIGVEPQYCSLIFKFQKLHAKHEYKGTGIGLAIVKKLLTITGA